MAYAKESKLHNENRKAQAGGVNRPVPPALFLLIPFWQVATEPFRAEAAVPGHARDDGIGDEQGAAHKVGVVKEHIARRVDAFREDVFAVGMVGVGNGIAWDGRCLHQTIVARTARLLYHAPFAALGRPCKEVARTVLGLQGQAKPVGRPTYEQAVALAQPWHRRGGVDGHLRDKAAAHHEQHQQRHEQCRQKPLQCEQHQQRKPFA